MSDYNTSSHGAPDLGEPIWIIDAGVPGSERSQPVAPWSRGAVLRAEIARGGRPVPADAPGYLVRAGGQVSLIVAVLEVLAPTYHRDEDGDQPFVLIGEDGWWFRARVRAASPAEAADLLAHEATLARRAALERRRELLFAFGHTAVGDADLPERAEIAATAGDVPFGGQLGTPPTRDRLLVDRQAGVVWSLTWNGEPGDTWAVSNHGAFIARSQPLTADREELISALHAEYDLAAWRRKARVEETAAPLLIQAGWTVREAEVSLRCVKLTNAEDARLFLAHDRTWWRDRGWLSHDRVHLGKTWSAGEAARLAEAGISHRLARDLDDGGFRTIEAMLAASAPAVPQHPGRVLMLRNPNLPRPFGASATVTSDARLAAQWIQRHPDYWWEGAVVHTPDVAPVHVAYEWSLWDDGELLPGDWALIPPAHAVGTPAAAPMPTVLSAAAVHAFSLIARHAGLQVRQNRDVWAPLRDAVTHSEATVDKVQKNRMKWTTSAELIRHSYQVADGATVDMWEVLFGEGGMSGGEGEWDEYRSVWLDHDAALAVYRDRVLASEPS